MSAKYEQEQSALKEEIATLVRKVRRDEEISATMTGSWTWFASMLGLESKN